jgi:GTP:adenosylcobinamide-phosphate guanylyltransferase
MSEAPVVIPAHGPGTRLTPVTGGVVPKTLVPVAGEPILLRLLRAVRAVEGTRAIVYTPPSDRLVAACLESHGVPDPPVLGHRKPQGYLADLVAISEAVGDEFTVLDADLVVRHTELTAFLRAAVSTVDFLVGYDMLVGVSARPPSPDPRSIRVVVAADGTPSLADGAAAHIPRSVGAYHWRPSAVAAAREFVAAGRGTFHQFVADMVAARAIFVLVELGEALNVNTPAELAAAEEHVRSWRRDGRE